MQPYISGLRTLGRATVAAGMTLALVAPAYAQNLNLREGLYADENKHGEDWETCTLTRHENDPRIEWRNCSRKEAGALVRRMVRNGQLEGVFYHFPDGTMKAFYVVSPEAHKYLLEGGKNAGIYLPEYIVEGTQRYAAELKTATEIAERTIKPENDILANSERMLEKLKVEMRNSEERRKLEDEFWEKMKKIMEAKKPIR